MTDKDYFARGESSRSGRRRLHLLNRQSDLLLRTPRYSCECFHKQTYTMTLVRGYLLTTE